MIAFPNLSASRLLCLAGRHLRSRGRARRTQAGFSSRCKRCGVAMVKPDGGKWIVDKTAEAGADVPVGEPTSPIAAPATPEAGPDAALAPRRRLWPWRRKRQAAPPDNNGPNPVD